MASLPACKNCGEEYDNETRMPLVAVCGHSICKACYHRSIGESCIICGESTFQDLPAKNYLAAALIREIQQARDSNKYLIGNHIPTIKERVPEEENLHIQKAKMNIDKPESSRAWKERDRNAEHRSMYEQYERIGERIESSTGFQPPDELLGALDVRPGHIVIIKNINPNWSILDINDHFNYHGKIIKSFLQRNAQGQVVSAEIIYDDVNGAQSAVEIMDDTNNGCGGKLQVNLKNPLSKNNRSRGRALNLERTIKVRPLVPEITESDLRRVFNEHGMIKACIINMDNPTGTAYIEYQNKFNAELAVRDKQNYHYPGTDIKLIVEPYYPLS